MKPPCINCPKQGCGTYHDICPEYKEFRKKIDTKCETRRKKKDTHNSIYEHIIETKSKIQKKRRVK